MLLSLPPTEAASLPPGRQQSEKDQNRRQKKAYKWYKQLLKPTKATMCSIVDYYANDNDMDITRQDVDILPWNLEETKVMKEAMKSTKKKTEKRKKKDKEEKKKNKKIEKECYGKEDTDFAKLNGYNKRPPVQKGQMGDSLRILDLYGSSGSLSSSSSTLDVSSSSLDASTSSLNASTSSLDASTSSLDASSSSLDASSGSWNQDHTSLDIIGSSDTLDASSSSLDHDRTQDHRKSADQLLTSKVEEEHKRRRDEHQRKRELVKKSMPEVGTQHKIRADHTTCKHKDVRRERAFLWYTRLGTPTRRQFKRKVTAVEWINVTPRDIDLLPWSLTRRVVNMKKMKAMVSDDVFNRIITVRTQSHYNIF